MNAGRPQADVCLLLEGSYPYVAGGVSTWTDDLITAHGELTFHVVSLLPARADLKLRYRLPDNVVGLTHVFVQRLPEGDASLRHAGRLLEELEGPVSRLYSRGGLEEVAAVLSLLAPFRDRLGSRYLLNSPRAWEMLLRMYHTSQPDGPFLDFFWTCRALLGGLYSVLLAELPAARVYHAISTGYAGLLAARARLETGRPVLLTEHGIYTTERRIEIAMADWLYEAHSEGLQISKSRRDLKDLWVDTFLSYSRACYESCDQIITLYEGNQRAQLDDGAQQEKLRIIPNGIDCARYSAIQKDPSPRPPAIALIGRVVPIKDVKTFLRACALLREVVPDLEALVLGPTDEDEEYFRECRSLVAHLALDKTVTFMGRVKLEDYLGRLDVIVLTSINEAQPLVILEAGAAGVPAVATEVGACREMILGNRQENPPLGPGGAVTPLSNPSATAQALLRLLQDPAWREQCSGNIQERVRRYYSKAELDRSYKELYEACRAEADAACLGAMV